MYMLIFIFAAREKEQEPGDNDRPQNDPLNGKRLHDSCCRHHGDYGDPANDINPRRHELAAGGHQPGGGRRAEVLRQSAERDARRIH
jgi:hypothetical protein